MNPASLDEPRFEFRYTSCEGGSMVLYRTRDGEWATASVHNAIDVRTGDRIGRWLGPARWSVRDALRFLGLDPVESGNLSRP